MARIGGLVVYSDDNHLTRSYARSLTDVLGARLWAAHSVNSEAAQAAGSAPHCCTRYSTESPSVATSSNSPAPTAA